MKKIIATLPAFMILLFSSCKKDWLDAKPDKKLVVPQTLADLQAILDNTFYIFNNSQPALGEIGSDDYYLTYAAWQRLYSNTQRNAYIWAKDVYNNEPVADWMLPYQRVFNENYILETIQAIGRDESNAARWDNVKGSALFCRGFDFYSLADEFEKPFDSATAASDPGIVLRLHSDISEKAGRSTVRETYNQVISDLKESLQYLPALPAFKTRPSKAAAYAMLARTFLNTGNYTSALQYADSAIALSPALLDYNSLDSTAPYPFPLFNTEVIYHTTIYYFDALRSSVAIVDSTLYNSYDANDLRKSLFINTAIDGNPRFRGGYEGYTGFAGIATDEMYLLSAECNARLGNIAAAMDRLNALLITRWRQGTFSPVTAATGIEALRLILSERRKELLFRGLRWTDLRRLNKDPQFAVTLTRSLNGATYSIAPNDNRYVYPIPDQEIQLNGIEQNPR